MRAGFKLLCALALILIGTLPPALADVPTEMSVQGRLTNGAGVPVPAGLKTLTFKIYDQQVGGDEIWPRVPGETQAISTDANGLWNAGVGEIIPLTEAVFQSPVRWLEITVNDGVNPAETLSRFELRTNPYTYRAATSEQADSLAGKSLSDLTDQFVDKAGDEMTGPLINSWTHHNLGTSIKVNNSNDGWGTYLGTGAGSWGLAAEVSGDNNFYNVGVAGSAHGNHNQFDANYGLLGIADGVGSMNVGVRGITGGAGSSSLSGWFSGGDFWVSNPVTSGTGGVVLPPDAIDDTEIRDEPGMSQGVNYNSVYLPSGSMIDVVTTTITIPDDGYIELEATTVLRLQGNAGEPNFGYAQIDEVSGGSLEPGLALAGAFVTPNSYECYYTLSPRKTYFKSAGTYTFRLEATELSGSGPVTDALNYSTITATYYPRSYGTVSTVASLQETGGLPSATVAPRVLPLQMNGAEFTSQSDLHYVDLRELELKVAREEAEAEKARRELLEARLGAASGGAKAVSTSATEPRP